MRIAETQLDKLKKQITALDNSATPLIAAVNDRNFWLQILEELELASARIRHLDHGAGRDFWRKLLGASEKRAGEPAPAPAPTPAGPNAKVHGWR